jgi:hypothetical protein
MITPPAPASGAAALLAASKAASLRIVDGVRTPTAELRDMRPCRNRMANHKMTKPARTSAITGTSIAATSTNQATREGRQRAAGIRAIPEQSQVGTSDDRGKGQVPCTSLLGSAQLTSISAGNTGQEADPTDKFTESLHCL